MRLSQRLAALGARFDGQALQAYEPGPPAVAQAQALAPVQDWPALRHWCLALPARRFALGVPGPRPAAQMSAPTNASARAAALALHLDGTHTLLACRGGADRLALRARVKWQDWVGIGDHASALPTSRIWDSGRARSDVAALLRFQPRRPTFIVIDGGSAAAWVPALASLQQHSGGWRCPVRVLWLLADEVPLAADSLAVD